MIKSIASPADIKSIFDCLRIILFLSFTLAFLAPVTAEEKKIIDLSWQCLNLEYRASRLSAYFRAKALRQQGSHGSSISGAITINGRVGQLFVVCAQRVVVSHFDQISSAASDGQLQILRLTETTGQLELFEKENCPGQIAAHYPYHLQNQLRSTEPFLATRKGTYPNDFKRPPFMPAFDKTTFNLVLLPTLNLPANWRDYLSFAGIYHWLVDQPEEQAGITLLVRFDGQSMMVLAQSDTEFSLEFERHQLADTLSSASLHDAIIQLPIGKGGGQPDSLSGTQGSCSPYSSGQRSPEKQSSQHSGQAGGAGDGAGDDKRTPEKPDPADNTVLAEFGGTFRFDVHSAYKICDRAEEIMVYGFQHCRYTQVTEALRSDRSPFKKVYDCSIGGPYAPEDFMTTLEGNRLSRISIPGLDRDNVVRELKQYCKAGLVNMLIENVKRERQKKSLIPLLFIVDIDGNQHRLTPDAVSNKKYTFVTMGELRRAYKLCEDPKLHPKIKEIARTTFKFAKTCQHQDKKGVYYSLQQIEPFWKNSGWDEAWQARISESEKEVKSAEEVSKRAYWRDQLNESLK